MRCKFCGTRFQTNSGKDYCKAKSCEAKAVNAAITKAKEKLAEDKLTLSDEPKEETLN